MGAINMEKLLNVLRGSGGAEGGGKVFAGLMAIGGGLGAISVGSQAFYTVPGGHRVGGYDRLSGVDMEVKNEGLHFMIPWLQRPNMFDIRTRPFELTSLTGSRDLQMVNMRLVFCSNQSGHNSQRYFRILELTTTRRSCR